MQNTYYVYYSLHAYENYESFTVVEAADFQDAMSEFYNANDNIQYDQIVDVRVVLDEMNV